MEHESDLFAALLRFRVVLDEDRLVPCVRFLRRNSWPVPRTGETFSVTVMGMGMFRMWLMMEIQPGMSSMDSTETSLFLLRDGTDTPSPPRN